MMGIKLAEMDAHLPASSSLTINVIMAALFQPVSAFTMENRQLQLLKVSGETRS